MQIKRSIEKIPGGMMLVPLFLGALCHTFSPGAGKYFGSFTNGMITGTVPILAVWFFCMGASIKLSATGTVLRKSGTLVVTKIAVAWVVAAIASRIIPDFSKAVQTLIPFFAFALGNTIDLTVIAQTGLLGILLGVAVIIVTGIPLIIADKLIGGGDGTAGIAASSSAGAAVATPVLIAEMVPAFKPMAPAATSLVATAVIVTSILVPILTSIWSRKVKARAAKIEILGTVK
ncbi:2-keto-3-deoxygluconate permease [Escherichia coli]|nr:2-keto-3-deoxygluconate permease [Escherichia coli]EFA6882746.1 2-keto-3-deoxygluconate permease [Escherichia coli]EFC1808158.1 2-keto-3-deoxygluconate permease [Escherichia coli]EFC6739442.1 2-keto-3-deoxygluconate permease [Escherichia coli]EGO4363633.1 2-keto-3-deoxygluconate permease [Escherichia coli]